MLADFSKDAAAVSKIVRLTLCEERGRPIMLRKQAMSRTFARQIANDGSAPRIVAADELDISSSVQTHVPEASAARNLKWLLENGADINAYQPH